MAKFHITENGPAACSATVRECPYGASGGEHFESRSEAESSFAESLGGTAPVALRKSKKFAPERLDGPPVTAERIYEILNSDRKFPRNIGKPLMFGLIGSNMYGLDTPDSDQDIWVLAEGKGTGYSETPSDSFDFRIDTVLDFYDSAQECTPETIDMLRSREHQTIDSKFAPLLENFRFSEYTYIRKMRNHAFNDFRNATNKNITEKRQAKALKVAIRSVMMTEKVTRDGQFYDPKFSEDEREAFYKIYAETDAARLSGVSSDELSRVTYERVRSFFHNP